MKELNFNEYWIVILNRNPNYTKSSEDGHKKLMNSHFTFIRNQGEIKNLYAAVPMTPGGLYFFDGGIEENKMISLLQSDASIKQKVFDIDLRKGFVPPHTLIFILEENKKRDVFDQNLKKMQME